MLLAMALAACTSTPETSPMPLRALTLSKSFLRKPSSSCSKALFLTSQHGPPSMKASAMLPPPAAGKSSKSKRKLRSGPSPEESRQTVLKQASPHSRRTTLQASQPFLKATLQGSAPRVGRTRCMNNSMEANLEPRYSACIVQRRMHGNKSLS